MFRNNADHIDAGAMPDEDISGEDVSGEDVGEQSVPVGYQPAEEAETHVDNTWSAEQRREMLAQLPHVLRAASRRQL